MAFPTFLIMRDGKYFSLSKQKYVDDKSNAAYFACYLCADHYRRMLVCAVNMPYGGKSGTIVESATEKECTRQNLPANVYKEIVERNGFHLQNFQKSEELDKNRVCRKCGGGGMVQLEEDCRTWVECSKCR